MSEPCTIYPLKSVGLKESGFPLCSCLVSSCMKQEDSIFMHLQGAFSSMKKAGMSLVKTEVFLKGDRSLILPPHTHTTSDWGAGHIPVGSHLYPSNKRARLKQRSIVFPAGAGQMFLRGPQAWGWKQETSLTAPPPIDIQRHTTI